eukprot:SAG31_NODE_6379_length_2039_cov_3.442784_1_plen_52_part_10
MRITYMCWMYGAYVRPYAERARARRRDPDRAHRAAAARRRGYARSTTRTTLR